MSATKNTELKWNYKECTWYRRWDILNKQWFENDFLKWLDDESKGGWEVVGISRNELSRSKSTWCIFKKALD